MTGSPPCLCARYQEEGSEQVVSVQNDRETEEEAKISVLSSWSNQSFQGQGLHAACTVLKTIMIGCQHLGTLKIMEFPIKIRITAVL
jgi:hypothetical protein